MNDFDRQLRAALSAEEIDVRTKYDEPALLEQVIETFRGRNRWLVAMMFAATTAWFIFACVSAYQFFQAEEIRAIVAWAAAFGLSLLAIAMLKIWYWMELNKNAVTREVKRLELLLSRVLSSAKALQ